MKKNRNSSQFKKNPEQYTGTLTLILKAIGCVHVLKFGDAIQSGSCF